MIASMPDPTATVVKSGKGSYGQTQREVKTTWVLNPEAEGVPQVVVALTTYHYGNRKMFSSSMTWGTREPAVPGSVFSVETWASDHKQVRVYTSPVARYSVKAMESHHAVALTEVEAHWETCYAVFAEAAERSGLVIV